MNKFALLRAVTAFSLPLALLAQETSDTATVLDATGIVASQEIADASADVVAEEQSIVIDAEEKCQQVIDEFMQKKQAVYPDFAWGQPDEKGIIYYYTIKDVKSKTASDPDFIKRRQMAYVGAFAEIRNSHVKYGMNSSLKSHDQSSFLYDPKFELAHADSNVDAVKRLGEKVVALTEAELDSELKKRGIDPAKFGSAAKKRKQLSEKILRDGVVQSGGSCAGISTVKTFEGKGTDGAYSIGVIAKYDPELVVLADCFHRKVVPACLPDKNKGMPVAKLLKSRNMTENFGTRLYYDENGMPALLSFGQWSSGVTQGMDRTERKLIEKAALKQAEAQANIDMNNFIAGSVSYDELAKAADEYTKSVVFGDNGAPVEVKSELSEVINWNSNANADDSLAGRTRVYAQTLKHPDTSAMITVVAINWSYTKLAQLHRDRELIENARKPKALKKNEAPIKQEAGVREGDEYDF